MKRLGEMKKQYSAKLDNLAQISADVESFCKKKNLQEVFFPINLCLDELFTNIVIYGYKEDSSKSVEIEIAEEPSAIRIFVRDRAPAFNPLRDAPPPDVNSTLQERDVGGLGIFFLHKNMDELAYKRENGVNELMMLKKI